MSDRFTLVSKTVDGVVTSIYPVYMMCQYTAEAMEGVQITVSSPQKDSVTAAFPAKTFDAPLKALQSSLLNRNARLTFRQTEFPYDPIPCRDSYRILVLDGPLAGKDFQHTEYY